MKKNLYVIGLGYVGLPLAVSASKIGYKVFGFDIDSRRIKNLKNGISENIDIVVSELIQLQADGTLEFIDELPKFISNSIFVIAVPTPLNEKRAPDLSAIESACDFIAASIGNDCLVINESTSYIGTLRNLIKFKIDDKSGITSTKYAVAPERIDPGNKFWNIKNTPRIIGGLDEIATSLTTNFYKEFCDEVVKVSSPEVAEASKLFENTFRQVNIALVNEFSDILKSFGVSSNEALNAASTKPFGFMQFMPSIGVGGHCIPIDPTYLSYSADLVNVETSLIKTADAINLENYKKIAKRIENKFQGNLKGRKIQVAGITYKINVSDLRESPALKLISELRDLGAQVTWHDPLVKSFGNEKSMSLDSNIDLGLIVTPHNEINFSVWKESNTFVFDLSTSTNNFGWPKFF